MSNTNLICQAGLNPSEWIIRHENAYYLYLGGIKSCETVIIDKAAKKVIKTP